MRVTGRSAKLFPRARIPGQTLVLRGRRELSLAIFFCHREQRLAVVLTFGSAGDASTVIAASNLRAKEPEWSFDRIGDGHFGRSAGRRDVGLRPG